MSSYLTAEYLIAVNDLVANNHYASKLITMHDTASAYLAEYGVVYSNSSVGTFSATAASGNVFVQFTPTSTSTSVRFVRILT